MSDDVAQEITALSTKLIEAIEKQAALEDQVQVLRRENEHIRRESSETQARIASGQLVEASSLEKEIHLREVAEKESSRLQGEIEELTGSLFDEANRMVSDANRQTAEWQKKNEQLERKLEERDVLLDNYQQQLAGLKEVLQDLAEREDKREGRRSDPDKEHHNSDGSVDDEEGSSQKMDQRSRENKNTGEDFASLSLSCSIRPLIRRDLRSFAEFLSVAGFFNNSPSSTPSVANPSSSTSTISANNEVTPASTPTLASGSFLYPSPFSPRQNLHIATTTPLKEFKFFKRSIADDIDPTLRLENAPGLSWLARRSLMTAILDGLVVIEPISGLNEGYLIGSERYSSGGEEQSSSQYDVDQHLYLFPTNGPPVATKTPCALCGEQRTSSLLYARLHNLRIDKHGLESGDDGSSSIGGYSLGYGSHHRTNSGGNGATGGAAPVNGTSIVGSVAGSASGIAIGGSTASSSSGGSSSVVSTGYPLCFYCLTRVRAVCDYVMFVKAVRDGVWKADDVVSQKRAYEECVRLKERMFWARMAGGFRDETREKKEEKGEKTVEDLKGSTVIGNEGVSSLDGSVQKGADGNLQDVDLQDVDSTDPLAKGQETTAEGSATDEPLTTDRVQSVESPIEPTITTSPDTTIPGKFPESISDSETSQEFEDTLEEGDSDVIEVTANNVT